MSDSSKLRFPSGASQEQVQKDAKKIQRDSGIDYHQALDLAAAKHGAHAAYRVFVTQQNASQSQPPDGHIYARTNIQFCTKCERPATRRDFLNLPRCDYHIDPDVDDSEVPPYKGTIPDEAVCFDDDCMEIPTVIIGGQCFCEYHSQEIKRGARYTRKLMG